MIRPITDTLRHLGAGCLLDEASEKLADLVKAVDQTGKSGKLVITLDVRKATSSALAVTGECKVKKPEPAKIEALLFPTPEGNLLTEDPRQGKLDIRPVAAVETTVRDAATAA